MANFHKFKLIFRKDEAVLREVEAAHQKLEADMKKLNYEDGMEENLMRKKSELRSRIGKLQDQVGTQGNIPGKVL